MSPSLRIFRAASRRPGALVYFIVIFLAVVAYALWPSKQKQFDEAARMPLRED